MPRLAILFGALLILLGVGGYVGTGRDSVTALIPAFFGLPLVALGWAALREAWRMHAMHAAAVLALLGVVGALGRPAGKLFSGELEVNTPLVLQLVMALLCAVFLGLCVKSFIDARRRSSEESA